MIKCIICPALSSALENLKTVVSKNEADGKKTIIFCEDRLTLAAERTVCAAVGGTFSAAVYTFARFLSAERGKRGEILSSQGSAMVIRSIIENNKSKLKLFGKFSAATAAASVYDTIALLYSSKISAEDVARAAADGLLESKLHDIAVIYSEYESYLNRSGKTDRNAYLGELPEVISSSAKIAESEVVFLGFQSFTRSSLECVSAAFGSARGVYGLFIGGEEDIYVNEAPAAFLGAAEAFGGAACEYAESTLIPEAELFRKSLFNPESFFAATPMRCKNVFLFEAADEEEELEYIAANIKKHVLDGKERYAKISVMVPDVAGAERTINRIFTQYRIPYYADRRHNLSDHPVCAFILNYLLSAASGCSPRDIDGVISSPLFPADANDRDIFRNYALRLAAFRGGVKREPDRQILQTMNFDYDSVQRVRTLFLKGLENIPLKGSARDICGGLREILEQFNVRDKLSELSEKYRDSYPTAAEFSGRVYDAVLSVISEAEEVSGGDIMQLREFIKILKSGFGALEISLIPPKADAVFVGDLAGTANTGSNVVFAAGLTGDVPASSSDTALLTDREIAALEKVNIDISPKIRQVNMRRRETTALNLCAFRKSLYLSYPVRSGGEECAAGEIIAYAKAVFRTTDGRELKRVTYSMLEGLGRALPYYASERAPALKRLTAADSPDRLAAVYAALSNKGLKAQADRIVSPKPAPHVSDGRALFVTYNSISPTALETYFSCPYKNFMQQGLKLQERAEGVIRPLDTGNFIHSVLQTVAPELSALKDEAEVRARAGEIAGEMLKLPAYSSILDCKSGEYTAEALVKEAADVSAGTYVQLANSSFTVEKTESRCEIDLGGVKINGRIDRIDGCGDMVRIIDYKTGLVDSSATLYYMGLKLQLPLYLTAAAEGRRAVAAYYFPASVEYRSKEDGVFRLQGFMDGSDEVVSLSDNNIEFKKKSAYFDAYLGGKKIDSAMSSAEFNDFIKYSALVAKRGTKEMLEGYIAPSPAEDACKFCKAGGSCHFAAGVDGAERTSRSVKCAEIAEIVRRHGKE